MKLRTSGVIVAMLFALMPRPAQAQDFIKNNWKHWVEKTGVYVSASSRTAVDDEVDMGTSIGVSLGMSSEHQHTGKKYPFSFSAYGGDLETVGGATFGHIRARQIMSGFGYSWVHGKLVYGTQLGIGYSFNKVTLNSGVAEAFGVPEPVGVSVGNSFVIRPLAKVEYFVHPKISLRTQASYTHQDPDVIVHTVTQDFEHQWRTNHYQLSAAVGIFPFRK